MTKKFLNIRPSIKSVAAIALLLLIALALRDQVQNISQWFSDREAIVSSIEQMGIWAPIVFFILVILQVFVAIIPGHALILAGAYSFGFWPSFLLTTFSTVLGSQIAFYIGRKWGRSVVYKLADGKTIQRWDKMANKQGAIFFFFTFVLPIFPSDLMTYVAGLGTISAKRFLAANISGRVVIAGFITLIGAQGLQMSPVFWVVSGLGLTAMLLGWKIYSRKHSLRNSPEKNSATNEGHHFHLKEGIKCA